MINKNNVIYDSDSDSAKRPKRKAAKGRNAKKTVETKKQPKAGGKSKGKTLRESDEFSEDSLVEKKANEKAKKGRILHDSDFEDEGSQDSSIKKSRDSDEDVKSEASDEGTTSRRRNNKRSRIRVKNSDTFSEESENSSDSFSSKRKVSKKSKADKKKEVRAFG
jgi:hypothetical protein